MNRTKRRVTRGLMGRVWLALAGLLFTDLLGWRHRPSQRERASEKMHEAVAAVSEGLERAEHEVAGVTAASTRQLTERLHDMERSSAKLLGSVHVPASRRDHKDAMATVADAKTQAGEAVKAASERATATTHQLSEQAAARAQRIADQASNLALERTRELRERIASSRGRAPEAQQRLNEELLPMLREVANQAATTALALWQSARERATEAAGAAQSEVGPRASHASQAVAAEAERAREAVEHGGDRLRESAAAVSAKVGDVRDQTQTATKQAATATVKTSRDTGALFLWAGAASALIFFVLLSEERRRQLKELASTLVTQVQQLRQDIQGYDEEF